MANLKRGYVEIFDKKKVESFCRKATPAELKKYSKLRAQIKKQTKKTDEEIKKLDKLIKKCDHKVVYDLANRIYDHRYCYACHKLIAMI